MCCRKNNFKKELAVGKKVENIVFVVTIVAVLVLFTLPIIFYYTPGTYESSSFNSINSSNNSNVYISGENQNCTKLSWSQQSNNASKCFECTDGGICENFLHQWSQCAIGSTGNLLRVGVTKQEQSQGKDTIGSLNAYLNYYPQCQQASLPFICQYFFPLADCATGSTYTATREDCVAISTGVCAELWAIATSFGYASLLPDCYSLPNAQNSSKNSSMNFPNKAANKTNDLVCREDFVKTDLICEPRCDRFEQSSHTDSLIMIYSEVIATSIALIFAIITTIVALKEFKRTLTYPTVLVFFQIIGFILLTTVLIITACDRFELYCSSVSLLETLDNPTPFCKFSGAVFHYVIVNSVLLWFFHIAIFFHKVMFPFQANRFEKMGRNKYIFATVTILSLLLPLPAVIISLSVEKLKYNIHRFPTTLCISNGDMWFYSATLPMDILLAAGIIMLIIIFWSIRRKAHLFKKKDHTKLSTAEKKIIVVFTSFIIFGAFVLGHVSDITTKSKKFELALVEYFQCEAFGHIPGKCDRGTFDKIYSPYMSAIAYMLMGLVPLSILNFILKWSSVKSVGNKAKILTKRYSSFLLQGKSSYASSSENTPESSSSSSVSKSSNTDENSAV